LRLQVHFLSQNNSETTQNKTKFIPSKAIHSKPGHRILLQLRFEREFRRENSSSGLMGLGRNSGIGWASDAYRGGTRTELGQTSGRNSDGTRPDCGHRADIGRNSGGTRVDIGRGSAGTRPDCGHRADIGRSSGGTRVDIGVGLGAQSPSSARVPSDPHLMPEFRPSSARVPPEPHEARAGILRPELEF